MAELFPISKPLSLATIAYFLGQQIPLPCQTKAALLIRSCVARCTTPKKPKNIYQEKKPQETLKWLHHFQTAAVGLG